MLEIKCFEFGLFGTNTYVVRDGERVFLIDPACSSAYEEQQLFRYFSDLWSQIPHFQLTILATHGHLDHLWGAKWATDQWHTSVYMHEADIPMAKAMQQQYDLFGIERVAEAFPVQSFAKLQDANHPFELIYTPGHTPGSVCFYWPKEKVLFSGDTLFCMGYGRTDLPGGNYRQLVESLQYLFSLPADTQVYPGHGEYTTIGQEAR